MAIIQYTAIVNQIRGKLNGSVFNKNRSGYTLQSKQTPKKAQTPLQLVRRANFSTIQRTWKELTIGQRALAQLSAQNNPTRNRFGDEVVLSGYNHFVKLNLMRLLSGNALLKDVISASAPPYSVVFDGSHTEFSNTPNGNVNITTGASLIPTATNAVSMIVFCYISFPHSKGITNYTGRWFFVGSLGFSNRSMPTIPFDLDFETKEGIAYPVPAQPQQILIRLDFWASNIGALVQRIESLSTY